MKKIVIYSLLFNLLLLCFSACKSPYRYLKERQSVECELVGFGANPSTSYPKYEKFRDETSIAHLKKYTASKSVTLKTYAYWALLEKMEEGYLEIFDKALSETDSVTINCGCKIWEEAIAITTYNNYWEKQFGMNYDPEDEEVVFIGNRKKMYELDSLILHHPIQHDDLIYMARNNAFYQENRSNK